GPPREEQGLVVGPDALLALLLEVGLEPAVQERLQDFQGDLVRGHETPPRVLAGGPMPPGCGYSSHHAGRRRRGLHAVQALATTQKGVARPSRPSLLPQPLRQVAVLGDGRDLGTDATPARPAPVPPRPS